MCFVLVEASLVRGRDDCEVLMRKIVERVGVVNHPAFQAPEQRLGLGPGQVPLDILVAQQVWLVPRAPGRGQPSFGHVRPFRSALPWDTDGNRPPPRQCARKRGSLHSKQEISVQANVKKSPSISPWGLGGRKER